MMIKQMTKLQQALDESAWMHLAQERPELAQAIEAELSAGASPEDVQRFVMKATGQPRLAQQLEQAARHLARV